MLFDIRSIVLDAIQNHLHKPALWVNKCSYTYQQMTAIACALNKQWQSLSITNIAILSQRDLSAYAAIWGCYLGGKTYIPLNQRLASKQIIETLEETGCTALVIDKHQLHRLSDILEIAPIHYQIFCLSGVDVREISARYPDHEFYTIDSTEDDFSFWKTQLTAPDGSRYAYIMQTSGSTGKPKRIAVNYDNLHSYLGNIYHRWPMTSDDRVAQFSDLSFDLSVHDIFCAMMSGACLYSLPELVKLNPVGFIRHHQLTAWLSVPTVIELCLQRDNLVEHSMPSLRLSFFCGQALLPELAYRWEMATGCAVINLYGPTECTVAVTSHLYQSCDDLHFNSVPIGNSFSDHQLAIIDEEQQWHRITNTLANTTGELCLSGPQLTEGYLNDKTNTAKAYFLKDGIRWYRTGDLVSIRDSHLIHLGRLDYQVKIAGQRVELGEIETIARQVTQSHSIAIVPWPLSPSGYASGTVAFVSKPEQWQPNQWISECKKRLNPIFVPKEWYILDKLPLNINGKTDIKALQKQLETQIL